MLKLLSRQTLKALRNPFRSPLPTPLRGPLQTRHLYNTLQGEISKLAGIPYLKEATKDEADKVANEIRSFYYGRSLRMIFPCILSVTGQARWVFFIVDCGAPLTYISTEVSVRPY
jgi:hypothetical protein